MSCLEGVAGGGTGNSCAHNQLRGHYLPLQESSTFHCTIVGDDEDEEDDGDDNSIEEDKAVLTINSAGIISLFKSLQPFTEQL